MGGAEPLQGGAELCVAPCWALGAHSCVHFWKVVRGVTGSPELEAYKHCSRMGLVHGKTSTVLWLFASQTPRNGMKKEACFSTTCYKVKNAKPVTSLLDWI